jgi:hypothetical protein
MAKPLAEPAPLPAFPLWPFSCLEYYQHALRDFGRCNEAMTHATDAMDAVRAEGDYGLSLWQDTLQAYFDLAVLPMTLAAKAAERAAPARQAAE